MLTTNRQRRREKPPINRATSTGSFAFGMGIWKSLPVATQTAFNLLAVKMQQAGLLPAGPRQTGCTVFMQLNRAARSVYGDAIAVNAPNVPVSPPAPPQFALTATQTGYQTKLILSAPAYESGCQVWCSRPFLVGIRDPFAQRMKLIGALPQGWPDGGADLSAMVPIGFRTRIGYGLVVKIVPVSPDGFLGSPLAELCIVGEQTLSLTTT